MSDWHDWRAQGLGASDAPIIMGVSPWSTPYQLWEQKTKRVKKDFSNWATARGNRLEPVVRARHELETNLSFPAVLVMNEEFPFVRASLDGYNAEHGIVLEIKCPGREDHGKAVEGRVPEKYYPQLQHQLLACPAAKLAHYYSFDGHHGVLIKVERDRDYQKRLFEELCKFWQCIKEDTPPEFIERDFKKVQCSELLQLLNDYSSKQKEIEEIKKKIFDHKKVAGRSVQIGPWRIRDGAVVF